MRTPSSHSPGRPAAAARPAPEVIRAAATLVGASAQSRGAFSLDDTVAYARDVVPQLEFDIEAAAGAVDAYTHPDNTATWRDVSASAISATRELGDPVAGAVLAHGYARQQGFTFPEMLSRAREATDALGDAQAGAALASAFTRPGNMFGWRELVSNARYAADQLGDARAGATISAAFAQPGSGLHWDDLIDRVESATTALGHDRAAAATLVAAYARPDHTTSWGTALKLADRAYGMLGEPAAAARLVDAYTRTSSPPDFDHLINEAMVASVALTHRAQAAQ